MIKIITNIIVAINLKRYTYYWRLEMRKDIIIIDDDRDLCTLLQESLLQENICADISCNGFDGIKSVKIRNIN